jgi:hypothetical protein
LVVCWGFAGFVVVKLGVSGAEFGCFSGLIFRFSFFFFFGSFFLFFFFFLFGLVGGVGVGVVVVVVVVVGVSVGVGGGVGVCHHAGKTHFCEEAAHGPIIAI